MGYKNRLKKEEPEFENEVFETEETEEIEETEEAKPPAKKKQIKTIKKRKEEEKKEEKKKYNGIGLIGTHEEISKFKSALKLQNISIGQALVEMCRLYNTGEITFEFE